MTSAIILYGPPACGKDTITRELQKLDERYKHYERLKTGLGRTEGYRVVTESALCEMRLKRQIIYSNERYGSTYAVDRPHLDELVDRNEVPILHLGQIAGITAIVDSSPLRWLVVGLWCSRAEAAMRLKNRCDARESERLDAWDSTLEEIQSAPLELFGVQFNTERFDVGRVARAIDLCARR